jgi:hypothetical protein
MQFTKLKSTPFPGPQCRDVTSSPPYKNFISKLLELSTQRDKDNPCVKRSLSPMWILSRDGVSSVLDNTLLP